METTLARYLQTGVPSNFLYGIFFFGLSALADRFSIRRDLACFGASSPPVFMVWHGLHNTWQFARLLPPLKKSLMMWSYSTPSPALIFLLHDVQCPSLRRHASSFVFWLNSILFELLFFIFPSRHHQEAVAGEYYHETHHRSH